MNVKAMWVEPRTVVQFANCDRGCAEKVPGPLSQEGGDQPLGVQILEQVKNG